ncbi:TPA: hypothetical protein ACIYMC_005236, partial [Escherichia coli]|uniref:hypothetical protein n=1 Tax=Escherichia coli TaxID=562 RepID=UPI0037729DF9
ITPTNHSGWWGVNYHLYFLISAFRRHTQYHLMSEDTPPKMMVASHRHFHIAAHCCSDLVVTFLQHHYQSG